MAANLTDALSHVQRAKALTGALMVQRRLTSAFVVARFYGQPDTNANAVSIDPIYRALCASIFQRRELLREGVSVYDISKVALIDIHELNAAHEEKREPLLTLAKPRP